MDRAKGQVSAALRAVILPEPDCGPAVASLGLEHVPKRIAELSAGMIYSLACDQQAVRLPLGAAALTASLRTGKKCVLLTAGDPSMYLRKARLAGFDLGEYARQGVLALFQLAAEADKQVFRIGPEGFVRELDQHVGAEGAFLVLDQADPLFMLSDPRASAEAAQVYLNWLGVHEHTALALFAPSAMAPREYLALRRVAENFAGFAVARSSYGGASLEIRHWFAAGGASPRETFPLPLLVGAGWSGAGAPAAQDELPPVESVICVRGTMDLALPGCRDWQEVASLPEALQAARRSEAATLVLPFRQASDFSALCRLVAAVRAMGRPEVRVVVRECVLRLRATQALALMRLGCSALVPLGTGELAAKRIVDLMRETRFTRAHETDVQQVEDESAHYVASAATTVPMFCEAVEGLLAAADAFDFESCLVRIPVPRSDAEKLLAQARQAGRDLIGVSRGDAVWLFLFGCPHAALPAVMKRLTAKHSALKWSAQREPGAILLELEALRAA